MLTVSQDIARAFFNKKEQNIIQMEQITTIYLASAARKSLEALSILILTIPPQQHPR